MLLELISAVRATKRTYPMAEAIAAYARDHAGKRVDKRALKALGDAHPEWCFAFHKSELSWDHSTKIAVWRRTEYKTLIELTVTDQRKYAVWFSEATLRAHRHNVCFFEGAANINDQIERVTDANGEHASGIRRVVALADQIALLVTELKGELELVDPDRTVVYELRKILKDKTGEDFTSL